MDKKSKQLKFVYVHNTDSKSILPEEIVKKASDQALDHILKRILHIIDK